MKLPYGVTPEFLSQLATELSLKTKDRNRHIGAGKIAHDIATIFGCSNWSSFEKKYANNTDPFVRKGTVIKPFGEDGREDIQRHIDKNRGFCDVPKTKYEYDAIVQIWESVTYLNDNSDIIISSEFSHLTIHRNEEQLQIYADDICHPRNINQQVLKSFYSIKGKVSKKIYDDIKNNDGIIIDDKTYNDEFLTIKKFDFKNMPKRTCIYCSWTERERGWGFRPDGFSIHIEKEHLSKYLKSVRDREAEIYKGEVPDEYSEPDNNFTPVFVTQEIFNHILKTNLEKGYSVYRTFQRGRENIDFCKA